MPFQPNASINTALWRYQSTDNNGVTTEDIINLAEVKRMKTNRQGQPKVWFWFDTNRIDSRDADLILSGAEATAFLADLDALFT